MAISITLGSGSIAYQTGSPVTFTNLNGGTVFPSGSTVILSVGYNNEDAELTSTITLNGVSMTLAVRSPTGSQSLSELWYLDLGANQTDSVTLTDGSGSAYGRKVVCLARYLTGAATGGPTATGGRAVGNTPATLTTGINLPANGIGISSIFANTSPIVSGATWSTTGNSTITASGGDFADSDATQYVLIDGHSITANAAWNPSCSATNFGSGFGTSPTIVGATWAQASAASVFATAGAPLIFMRDWPKRLFKPRKPRILFPKPEFVM